MTKEISTDAELMSRLLTTQPTPAECLVAAARIEQLAAWLTAAEAEVEKLREYYEAAEAYAAEKTTGNGMRLVRARAALKGDEHD